MRSTYILLISFALLSNVLFAQAPFTTDVKRVAVFKNGYAFTFREGIAQLENGWAYTTNVPAGALGTVWGYTLAPNARVVELLASNSDKKESRRIENLAEYLLANESTRARFSLNYREKVIEGIYDVIVQGGEFATETKIAFDPDSYKRAADPSRLSVVVHADSGAMFLPLHQIATVEILGNPKIDKPVVIKENRLALKLAGASEANVQVGVAALERGIQWIPAYRVEVKGAPVTEAKLELEAVLVNDMTDLKDSEVYFVVGVPHFLFQNQLSPLSLNQTFSGVAGYLPKDAQILSNSLMTTVDGVAADSSKGSSTATVEDEEQSETESAEQLFLYKADGITLKKGERASMRLFSITVPCTEVFEWTIDDRLQPASYTSYDGQPIRVPEYSANFWYGLRLTNKTEMPWTTAPALSFRDWRPMGQDILTFTPKGADNVLRVSPATEVYGTHKLEEKSRISEQKKINGVPVMFDLITMEGTIHVRNVKNYPVNVTITRNLNGKIVPPTDGGHVTREALIQQSDNPRSVVKWNLMLPPGEKDISYTYRVYVRKQ
jgi:hypothetical protein